MPGMSTLPLRSIQSKRKRKRVQLLAELSKMTNRSSITKKGKKKQEDKKKKKKKNGLCRHTLLISAHPACSVSAKKADNIRFGQWQCL